MGSSVGTRVAMPHGVSFVPDVNETTTAKLDQRRKGMEKKKLMGGPSSSLMVLTLLIFAATCIRFNRIDRLLKSTTNSFSGSASERNLKVKLVRLGAI